MATRFEIHLQGMDVPEGLIDADRLMDIVRSLQEMASRLGRQVMGAPERGRPSKQLDNLTGLRIGLEKGSTTIIAERAGALGAFPLDLPDEAEVDRRIGELIEALVEDTRPDWVGDPLAASAADLVSALQRTAPEVRFVVDDVPRRTFATSVLHRETWTSVASPASAAAVTFTGRLFAVNLNTHRLGVQDDVGNQVTLPDVVNDAQVATMVGSYVTVVGVGENDVDGRLKRIIGASVSPARDPLPDQQVPSSVSLHQILSSATGPAFGGIEDLTDDEVDAFYEALR